MFEGNILGMYVKFKRVEKIEILLRVEMEGFYGEVFIWVFFENLYWI